MLLLRLPDREDVVVEKLLLSLLRVLEGWNTEDGTKFASPEARAAQYEAVLPGLKTELQAFRDVYFHAERRYLEPHNRPGFRG